MKKVFSLVLILSLAVGLLVGCTQDSPSDDKIVIGVSPEPHDGIVQQVVDNLEEEGIEVELIVLDDYVIPNLNLNDGELDANFIQHEPYLLNFNAERGMELVSIGGVHIEPMALYSNDFSSIEDLPDGAEIAIPNDATNGGRALLLLEVEGLITLDESVGVEATENDIVDNPKNLVFTALEAATLPRVLDEVDAAIINGNYALDAGLNPVDDGLIIEAEESPYANIVAVRSGEENNEKFVKLMEALQSDEIRTYLQENYKGAVVPAF